MNGTLHLTLPITGMTCANCVATIERNFKKLNGIQKAVVNLSNERAIVEYNPVQLGLAEIIARVQRSGYGIATDHLTAAYQHFKDCGRTKPAHDHAALYEWPLLSSPVSRT